MSDNKTPPEPRGEDGLSDRQRKCADYVASGLAPRDAARKAGFSESYARKASQRLLKIPAIQQAVETVRVQGRTLAAYDLKTAMAEAQAVCEFAITHKNAMAYCKAVELRAKLSGLMVERVETVTLDLKGALARAQARIVNAQTGQQRDAVIRASAAPQGSE